MKIVGADIISQTVGTTTSFLGYDGHGSTRTLTDAVGAVTNTFHFDGYGMDLGWGRDTDVEYNQVNKPATDMLYSGEQYDTPLQMQYLRARYYDQNVGGFNRLDDYAGNNSDPQSLHKYAYCHGDGVNGIDPSGCTTLVENLMVTGIISILATHLMLAIVHPSYVSDFNRWGESLPDALIVGISGQAIAIVPIILALLGTGIATAAPGMLKDVMAFIPGTRMTSPVLLGLTGVIGFELLLNLKSAEIAAYLFYGGGVAIPGPPSGALNAGFVWNAPNARAYNGLFASGSFAFGPVGMSVFGGPGGGGLGPHGIALTRALTPGGGASVMFTNYEMLGSPINLSGFYSVVMASAMMGAVHTAVGSGGGSWTTWYGVGSRALFLATIF